MGTPLSFILDFYILDAIASYIPPFGDRAKYKLYEDAKKAREELAWYLARLFHDYLFLASVGESRYVLDTSKAKGEITYKGMPTFTTQRVPFYLWATTLDPVDTWPKLIQIFKIPTWNRHYGGDGWNRVAQVGMQYYSLPNTVFVDQVVNLEHNGGSVFSKEQAMNMVGLHKTEIGPLEREDFLNWKRDHNILWHHPPIITEEIIDLILPDEGGMPFLSYLPLSRKAYYILRRWGHIYRKKDVPSWYKPEGEKTWPKDNNILITFGSDTLGPMIDHWKEGSLQYVKENQAGKPVQAEDLAQTPSDVVTLKWDSTAEQRKLLKERMSSGEYTYLV